MNSYDAQKAAEEIAQEHNITIVPASELSVDSEKILFPDLLAKANAMLEKSQTSLEKIMKTHKSS